jgi:hypothetical protein
LFVYYDEIRFVDLGDVRPLRRIGPELYTLSVTLVADGCRFYLYRVSFLHKHCHASLIKQKGTAVSTIPYDFTYIDPWISIQGSALSLHLT